MACCFDSVLRRRVNPLSSCFYDPWPGESNGRHGEEVSVGNPVPEQRHGPAEWLRVGQEAMGVGGYEDWQTYHTVQQYNSITVYFTLDVVIVIDTVHSRYVIDIATIMHQDLECTFVFWIFNFLVCVCVCKMWTVDWGAHVTPQHTVCRIGCTFWKCQHVTSHICMP